MICRQVRDLPCVKAVFGFKNAASERCAQTRATLSVYNADRLTRPTVQCGFMSQLLEGKTALILGVANRWSLAYAIAQAFQREGARHPADVSGRALEEDGGGAGRGAGRGARVRMRRHAR